ncbi:von Willebrand factor A domain-containing protein 1-like isoform X2 [Trichomycterus rosablanca]|uniref:von Willebrand factor A domain-containing protein 1-like isoform X2 n=1 Tax=Trichomycterus rosablanca TaxID=2290929 RepID=UPI002F35C772
MTGIRVACLLLLSACVWNRAPGSVWNCCEGDVLLLLDSSGSEFSRMLHFLSDLLRPFQLGRGQVRLALVQVHTDPTLEFDLDAHSSQSAFQEALLRTWKLGGKTNTEAALLLAHRLLRQPAGQKAPPRVVLWLTDGVEPGNVDGPIAALREEGVSVLAVSTGHDNYLLLSRAVTPPIEDHLHFVDIEDISIITEDLRDAIIELIRADRLLVQDVTSHSAVLQWRPVLSGEARYYELQYGETERNFRTDQTLTLPSDHSWTQLTDLQPDTPYRARLTTHTPSGPSRTHSTSFRTLPTGLDVLGPETVTVSESTPDRLRVSWVPVRSGQVERYWVEFGAIPHGVVRSVTVSGSERSAVLTQLQPGTHYLITITAVHSSGQQGAISVRACTQEGEEALPALLDLYLTPVGLDTVKVDWRGQQDGVGLQGYWVKWETRKHPSSSSISTSVRYLPAQSLSTVLTHLSPASKVCVSPVYRTAQGEGLCCTSPTYTASY